MPGRARTTKKLAQRIDLDYFKKLYPIPRWRRLLSAGVTLLGILWLGWAVLSGKQQAFNAGPLAPAHAILSQNCTSCHATQATLGRKVADAACLSCHDAPVHHVQQTFTPACADCHVEHRGTFKLAMTTDRGCTTCHSDLQVKQGRTEFTRQITGFNSDHPEFALLRAKAADPGTIKFGHQIHLKKDLRGANGPVQLKCADCHQRGEETMTPINFEKNCSNCHPLLFDRRFTEAAPHKSPQIVRDFLVAKFTQYIAAHPNEIGLIDPPADPRIVTPPHPPARTAAEWISQRTADAEILMWRKACKECHDLQYPNRAALPEVQKAAIPVRWLAHAEFDHKSHQLVACTECHASATNSKETKDVLLPGIQTCQQCHRGGGDSADNRCSECHVYHDWTKEKQVETTSKISTFR